MIKDDTDEVYGVEYSRHGQKRYARATKEVTNFY